MSRWLSRPLIAWHNLRTYGRFRRDHPDWPYVLATGIVLVLLGLSVPLLLAGCMSTGTKVTEEQLFAFRKGETSCFDIVATRGKPTLNELHPDGTRTMTYSYTQSQLKVENFLPIVAMLQQGQTAETTTVTLWCDAKNVLTGYTASQGQMQTGYGAISGGKQ
jgi:hypothetical protein